MRDVRKWRERRAGEDDDANVEAPQQPPGKMIVPARLAITAVPPSEVRTIFDDAVRRMKADIAGLSRAAASTKQVSLHAGQLKVLQSIRDRAIAEAEGTNDNPLKMFIHGGPGVAKSTTTQTAVRALEAARQRCAVVAADWAAAVHYAGTGARCSSMHNLMGWSERGTQTEAQAENRIKDLVRRLLYKSDAEHGLVGPLPVRWLIVTEVSKVSPVLFARLERELSAYVTEDFPFRLDRKQRQRTWGGLNVIVEGDCMQLDPVGCQSFWVDKPLPKVQVGIDLLINEFS
eukprot:gene15541-23064_t